MKNQLAFISCLTVCLLGGSIFLTNCAHSHSDGSSAGSSGFKLRPYEEKTLANGLRILYVPDQALPYLTFSLMIPTGAYRDSHDKMGVSLMTARLMEKGSVHLSQEKIAETFGEIGSEFSANASEDSTYFSASSLPQYSDQLFSVFSDVVLHPAFQNSEIEKLRSQMLAENVRRFDEPGEFADVATQVYVFPGHPYGNVLSGIPSTLKKIQRKDINKYYLSNYQPRGSVLAVIGQYSDDFKKHLEETFSTWSGHDPKDVKVAGFPEFPEFKGRQFRLVDKPGAVQSQIRIGAKGIPRKTKDYLALKVANTILGGAFDSRLMNRIRTQLGLTYNIHSGFEPHVTEGAFYVETFTKNDSTKALIEEVLKLLDIWKSSAVTQAEFEKARNYLAGQFPTTIETPEKFALSLVSMRRFDLPDSELANYLSDLKALNKSDIDRVIRTYFTSENLKILVYGDAKALTPQLSSFGAIEKISASAAIP